jgi:TPR repeat protein
MSVTLPVDTALDEDAVDAALAVAEAQVAQLKQRKAALERERLEGAGGAGARLDDGAQLDDGSGGGHVGDAAAKDDEEEEQEKEDNEDDEDASSVSSTSSASSDGGDCAPPFEQANAGDMNAQHDLGDAYYEGKGVEKNLKLAARWYAKAAAQGHVFSAFCLGERRTGSIKRPNRVPLTHNSPSAKCMSAARASRRTWHRREIGSQKRSRTTTTAVGTANRRKRRSPA